MSGSCCVLIIDDEADIRRLLRITLDRMGIANESVADLKSARRMLEAQPFDLCLVDMRLPDGDGLELVAYIQREHPSLPVAVITAHGSMETAIQALKVGAFDFLTKPIDLPVLRTLIHDALQLTARRHQASSDELQGRIIGHSQSIKVLRDSIFKLARNQSPVHISGESGVGKELVARMIHTEGPRTSRPFIAVNCGAIAPTLIESELFGHKKGSFTGAHKDEQGLFQAADGGTLFLDEIADLPWPMQVKLLRAIQEKRVLPVGGQQEIPVNIRLLSATHRDLHALVAQEAFRQDLFYRLNVIELWVPPLRQRREDIPELVGHILERICRENTRAPLGLSQSAWARLAAYDYPGNIRELENILERAAVLCEGDRIGAEHLKIQTVSQGEEGAGGVSSDTPPTMPGSDTPPAMPGPDTPPTMPGSGTPPTMPGSGTPPAMPGPGTPLAPEQAVSLDRYLGDMERQRILKALETTRWNRTAAARLLGISVRALRYRLEKLGLR